MKLFFTQQTNTMMQKLIFSSILLLAIAATVPAQEVQRTQPTFWWGISGAANVNMYTGTTQTLNAQLMVPAAFHSGFGVGGFGSLLLEYRPTSFLGFMLNQGYDNRGGSFDQVLSPCNCPEDLETNLSYATFQPGIRISPFGRNFHLFFGGAYSYNIDKSFAYTFDQNTGTLYNTTLGDFSNIRRDVFSTHVGLGYDIQLADAGSRRQIALSPFVSYHPYFGQAPRDVESWSVSTVRVGMALKFGKAKEIHFVEPVYEEKLPMKPSDIKVVNTVPTAAFAIRAPLSVPAKRIINESFPLRNYVFFEKGSSMLPSRYVKLSSAKAMSFTPEQLRTSSPTDQTGRSARQLTVYYNLLNVLGYRMNENPTSTVLLTGASAGDGEVMGKEYAETVKKYLVDVFGINSLRITTVGRNQPLSPSELPGGKNYLVMLREGDRRVDVVTSPIDLLVPLQIVAEQVDPLDSRILMNVNSADEIPFKSWNVEVTDEKGITKKYGPYTRKQESISANTILGDNAKGTYKFVLSGQTPYGQMVKKESTLRLVRNVVPVEEALRYSILFDFDQSSAVANYEQFLTKVVAPNIPNNGTVIIHGHTDIVGSQEYNLQLSERRAMDIREILGKAVLDAGKTGVRFETLAFGMDADTAPFENKLPEERFYNRTVIIDIVKPN